MVVAAALVAVVVTAAVVAALALQQVTAPPSVSPSYTVCFPGLFPQSYSSILCDALILSW